MAALGGHVDLVVSPAATLLPQIQSGQLRMIAITAPRKLEGVFASVPTWRELGANAVVSNWRVMVAPRGTGPQPIVYWDNTLERIVQSEEWKKMLEEDVLTNRFMKSAQTRVYLDAQYQELKALLTALGMTKS